MNESWEELDKQTGGFDGILNRPSGLRYRFTASSTDGSISDLEVNGVSGFIFGIDTEFDGDTPPNELTLIQKTKNGNTQWSPDKLTASGFRKPDSPEPVAGGFKISAAQTAAATNSATGILTIHFG